MTIITKTEHKLTQSDAQPENDLSGTHDEKDYTQWRQSLPEEPSLEALDAKAMAFRHHKPQEPN